MADSPVHPAGASTGAPASARRPKPGEEIEVDVLGIDARGGALGRSGDERVHLRRGRPGSRVRARVLRRRRSHLDAAVLEELERGPSFVEPRCAHFEHCGGCPLQDLPYERQLEELHRAGLRALEPLRAHGALPESLLAPVIPCEQRFAYRNKMEFTFSNRRWVVAGEPPGAIADFALGLHVRGRHEKVFDIRRCEIQFEQGNAILGTARALARERGLSAWDLRARTGLLRHLVLRKSAASGEILAQLVTSSESPEEIDPYAAEIVRRHPEITTLVHSINTRPSTVAVGERQRVLHGSGAMRESVAGLSFRVGPQDFFQVNTAQAERLVELVRDAASLSGGEVVWDLCAGTGLFALALAARAREVWGFEIAAAAVESARENARANGVANARFVAADLAECLRPERRAELGAPPPDACIADPPRAGLHPRAVDALVQLAPRRIVYVSCNLVSAARDLAPLLAAGWRLERAQPIDLTPHTPHLECVFALARPRRAERAGETVA